MLALPDLTAQLSEPSLTGLSRCNCHRHTPEARIPMLIPFPRSVSLQDLPQNSDQARLSVGNRVPSIRHEAGSQHLTGDPSRAGVGGVPVPQPSP
jgi:hypothetical protein